MKRDQLPLATLDGRHAGELLAHPCACGRHRCTLGEHIWQSTRDMTPGPRAQSFEPATAAHTTPNDNDPPPDPTQTVDLQFARAVQGYWDAARTLTRLIDLHRPDRWTPLPDPATDDQWCRHHLETIGQCENRYRGDLCQFCYRLKQEHGQLPDRDLLNRKHEAGYTRPRDLTEWIMRLPKTRARKRKKAS